MSDVDPSSSPPPGGDVGPSGPEPAPDAAGSPPPVERAAFPDPAVDAPVSAAPELAAGAGVATFVLLVVALAVGLGLRAAYAFRPDIEVGAWEADGFVTAWVGRPWDALSRVRPPAFPIALSQAGRSLGLTSVADVRWLAIGFSVLGLLAAVVCAASVAAVSGLTRRSVLRAAAWMTGLWAIHPTLVLSSVSPTPEVLVGTTGCLFVAALVWVRGRPGVVSALAAAVAGGAFVSAGGVLAAAALVVGVVVYLMPVPPAGRALTVLAGLALALGLGWFVQRGPDSERAWTPDTAWAYSWRAALGGAQPHPNDVPSDIDQRADQALAVAWDATTATDPLEVARVWGRRLAFDLMGPRRFRPAAEALGLPVEEGALSGTRAFGVLDLFLRGGLLLFTLTVLGLLRRGAAASSWPRAGAVVGALVWLLLLAAGAVGPFALAPFDLVLLGVAGAGVVGGDPRKAWTRRLAFAVGGVLLVTLLWTAGWTDRALDRWLVDLDDQQSESRVVVGLLADGGPFSGEDRFRVANTMSIWNVPLLRMPEAARVHAAEAWKALAPTDAGEAATELLVRTLVECRQYVEAAQLAEGVRAASPPGDRRADLLLHWVQDEERRAQNLPIRRP